MGKLHYFTVLLLIILLAVVSGWFFENNDNNPILTKEKRPHQPDYFLKNFTATTKNNEGKTSYIVKASYLEHYPDDDSLKLQQAIFWFYKNEIKIWSAQANQAIILQKSEIIYLTGNVILTQIGESKKKVAPVILLTEKLTIESERKLAYTKSKIKLIKGNNTIKSRGMRANMNNNKIEFLSNTQSYYEFPEK